MSVRKKWTILLLPRKKGKLSKKCNRDSTTWLHIALVPYWNNEMRLASGFTSRRQLTSTDFLSYKISWFQLVFSAGKYFKIYIFHKLGRRHEACSWDIEFFSISIPFLRRALMKCLLCSSSLNRPSSSSEAQIASPAAAAAIAVEGRRKRMEVRRRQQLLSNSPWSTVVVESPYTFSSFSENSHIPKKEALRTAVDFQKLIFHFGALLPPYNQTYRQRNNLGNGFYVLLVMVKSGNCKCRSHKS